jgi:NAD(P)-dependent dehydrogenase (short-subunit alcohol dehydrogenase family)
MGKLDGRVAIVTGGGDGIGRGIARRFAHEGARVLIADVDADAGARVAQDITELGGEARSLETDVRRKDDDVAMVDFARDTWGSIDILVNNAWGGATICAFEEKTDEQMLHGLHLAVLGPFWAMQAAYPHMKAQGWGRVINMCSMAGTNAFAGTLEYNTAKEGLRALTRTAAREWAPFGVIANVICPGGRGGNLQRRFIEHPELEAQLAAHNPMGRIGDPEDDVAPAAVFLASEDARYVTGNTLFVDGGGHINGMPSPLPNDRA